MIIRTKILHIKCGVCGQFKTEHKISTNKYGYFNISEGYCPHCLSMLVQEIKKEENEE